MTDLRVIDEGQAGSPPGGVNESFGRRLLELYRRVAHMEKGGKNDALGYKFLQETEIKTRLNQACRDLGIVIAQVLVTPVGEPTGRHAVAHVTVVLSDITGIEAGQVVLQGLGAGIDSTDKAPMKAVVAGFKYAIMNGCSISTGDDPEAANVERGALRDMARRIAGADLAELTSPAFKADLGTFREYKGFRKLQARYRARVAELEQPEASAPGAEES